MRILKGLFKFFYPLILFYTSAIASFGIVYCAFRVFTPNVFESLAFEIFGYILIAALTYPILMFMVFLSEKLKNAINNYSTMAKLSDFALTVFLTILIATIIICPSAVLFGGSLSNKPKITDAKQVSTSIEYADKNKTAIKPNTSVENPSSMKPSSTVVPTSTFQIKCTYTIVDNNHVGNDWKFEYDVIGDINVIGDYVYSVNEGDKILLFAKIIEFDNITDAASNSIVHTVSKSDIYHGFATSFYITVKENRGQFTNNTAKIKVLFQFIPVK